MFCGDFLAKLGRGGYNGFDGNSGHGGGNCLRKRRDGLSCFTLGQQFDGGGGCSHGGGRDGIQIQGRVCE